MNELNKEEAEQAKQAISEIVTRFKEAMEIVAEQLQPLANALAQLFPTTPADPIDRAMYTKRMRGRHYCQYVRKHNPGKAVHLKILSKPQTDIIAQQASQSFRKYRHRRQT